MTTATTERLLTAGEVADMLRVTKNALYSWRAAGLRGEVDPGPASFKIGSKVAYEESAVLAWLERQKAETASQNHRIPA